MRVEYMKRIVLVVLCFVSLRAAFSQQATVVSPNRKIVVSLHNARQAEWCDWYLKVEYGTGEKTSTVIPQIHLGVLRSDQNFARELRCVGVGTPTQILESYFQIHGKRSQRRNAANEVVVRFENTRHDTMNVVLRAYNDGVAFRYAFPTGGGSYRIKDELTSYEIPIDAKRWMEKWNPANEGLYSALQNDSIQQTWCYPALFRTSDSSCWYLIHEADVDRGYCGSRLSNLVERSHYKIAFPDPREADGAGEAMPTITLPWKSPWRVIIIGALSDIVESTLIDDVSSPSVVANTRWIKPGLVSWNYWSNNHGTKDYGVVCEFADLAAGMHWPYTLLDWEWDIMGNGGKLEDAVRYILSKGVKPLIWYSSGMYSWIPATYRDLLRTHEARVKEFAKLKGMGIAGVKVDFFESEKQETINYYLDLLEDAARFELMVDFHGCLVPRGWSRTYPHLMTQEGVRGAEWYNNGPEFTSTAPTHNTILPFTRNVVGPMDYTPVTFTNSQYPHTTSYGHELALCVVFESGLQHLADRPAGYHELPDPVRTLLMHIPVAWDDTKLLDGYPGLDVIIARQKGDAWYIGGLNAEQVEKTRTIALGFLPEGVKYTLTLFADGKHDRDFAITYRVVDRSSSVDVKFLRRGGFAASLMPLP
jgi:alpha-glucosidase